MVDEKVAWKTSDGNNGLLDFSKHKNQNVYEEYPQWCSEVPKLFWKAYVVKTIFIGQNRTIRENLL